MSKNRKQSRILAVLLTLEISTVLPDFACSIFRSRPLAVLRYVFACSRLFSLFALMAAFRYCFFLFSRNSSCSLTEKQLYRNTHSSATANAPDTALPCSVYSQEKISERTAVKSGDFFTALNCFLGTFKHKKRKQASFWNSILHQKNLTALHKCHKSYYSP